MSNLEVTRFRETQFIANHVHIKMLHKFTKQFPNIDSHLHGSTKFTAPRRELVAERKPLVSRSILLVSKLWLLRAPSTLASNSLTTGPKTAAIPLAMTSAESRSADVASPDPDVFVSAMTSIDAALLLIRVCRFPSEEAVHHILSTFIFSSSLPLCFNAAHKIFQIATGKKLGLRKQDCSTQVYFSKLSSSKPQTLNQCFENNKENCAGEIGDFCLWWFGGFFLKKFIHLKFITILVCAQLDFKKYFVPTPQCFVGWDKWWRACKVVVLALGGSIKVVSWWGGKGMLLTCSVLKLLWLAQTFLFLFTHLQLYLQEYYGYLERRIIWLLWWGSRMDSMFVCLQSDDHKTILQRVLFIGLTLSGWTSLSQWYYDQIIMIIFLVDWKLPNLHLYCWNNILKRIDATYWALECTRRICDPV